MRAVRFIFFVFASILVFLPNIDGKPNKTKNFLPLVTDISIKQKDITPFPRYYRTFKDEFPHHTQDLPKEGLADTQIAGTAQFTRDQLLAILQDLGTKVIVVDLRQETHFIMEDRDGVQVPISAFMSQNLGNSGKTLEEIAWDHEVYRHYILKQQVITLHYTKNGEVQYEDNDPIYEVSNVYTEKETVEMLNEIYEPGVIYKQLTITDHLTPPPEIVDDFLELYRNLEQQTDTTILFHCRAGRGRTGLLMVMSDMLANAQKHRLDYEQILKRQAVLGSPDFTEVDEDKVEQSLERHQFLHHFFQFAISEDGFASGMTYSDWLWENPID